MQRTSKTMSKKGTEIINKSMGISYRTHAKELTHFFLFEMNLISFKVVAWLEWSTDDLQGLVKRWAF